MRSMTIAALAALTAAWVAPAAAAEEGGAEAAIRTYCERLLGGASAADVSAAARQAGFSDQTLAGQRTLVQGELVLAVSDAPRVCFVQAPASMTMAEGFALADAWASRQPGARRSAATSGPDGRPVRGWSVPGRNIALIASHQQTAPGREVMAFILMPAPAGPAAR